MIVKKVGDKADWAQVNQPGKETAERVKWAPASVLRTIIVLLAHISISELTISVEKKHGSMVVFGRPC